MNTIENFVIHKFMLTSTQLKLLLGIQALINSVRNRFLIPGSIISLKFWSINQIFF